jgi:hypothetical protein
MSDFLLGFLCCYLATALLMFIDGIPQTQDPRDPVGYPDLLTESLLWPGAFTGRWL